MNANLDYVKYSKAHLHYNNNVVRREWHSLISDEVCVGVQENKARSKSIAG